MVLGCGVAEHHVAPYSVAALDVQLVRRRPEVEQVQLGPGSAPEDEALHRSARARAEGFDPHVGTLLPAGAVAPVRQRDGPGPRLRQCGQAMLTATWGLDPMSER